MQSKALEMSMNIAGEVFPFPNLLNFSWYYWCQKDIPLFDEIQFSRGTEGGILRQKNKDNKRMYNG